MSLLERKLEILEVINQVFDDFVAEEYQLACARECSACCTHEVTATTLEAWKMLQALKRSQRKDLLAKVEKSAAADLFRPKLTTNTLAMACMTRQEPPIEEPMADPGPCPLLEYGVCPEYRSRPFTCRGMFSTTKCQAGSEADPPPELVTIVTTIWQIIEHLDVGGLYGNLTDLLLVLSDEKKAARYEEGVQLVEKKLPPTRPVPGFLVPPEHEDAVKRFLEKLYAAECGGRTIRDLIAEMRNSPF